MKFNKLTHLSIIVVFAIIFIVVYLYYTISDVKKIHNEVKKLTMDIEKMNHSITSITGAILPLVTPQMAAAYDSTNEMLSCPLPMQAGAGASAGACIKPEDTASVGSQELHNIMQTIDDEDNEDSAVAGVGAGAGAGAVAGEVPAKGTNIDITQLDAATLSSALIDVSEETAEDLEDLEALEAPTTPDCGETHEPVSVGSMTAEELKHVPYEDIRKYCKQNNINTKGSKEVLIYRIKNL